jgi:D-inositol-3-phosphate glycosyltransferase
MQPLAIAMLSVHSSPTGPLGARDTGGMSVYIRQVARRLARRGHQVDVFTRACGQAPAPEWIDSGVRLIRLDMGPGAEPDRAGLLPNLPVFFAELERVRRREGRRYDLIHSHYWLSGLVGLWARQAWGAPHVVTFHTLGAVKNRLLGLEAEPQPRLSVESRLARDSDQILVTCRRERQHLLRWHPEAAGRVALIPCGVDLCLFRPMPRARARQELGFDARQRLILYVGRFAPEKGLERLLLSMAQLAGRTAPALLVVGGDGAQSAARQRMEALARSLGGGVRITFVGQVEQRRLPAYYSAVDALVVPSHYESFGLVALEALACGTPLAATRVGVMEELVGDGSGGALAADDSDEALATAIETVLRTTAGDDTARQHRRRIAAGYSWSRVAAAVERLYLQCRLASPPKDKAACLVPLGLLQGSDEALEDPAQGEQLGAARRS